MLTDTARINAAIYRGALSAVITIVMLLNTTGCAKERLTSVQSSTAQQPVSADQTLPWAPETIYLGKVVIGRSEPVQANLVQSGTVNEPERPSTLIPSCGCLHPVLEKQDDGSPGNVRVDFVYRAQGPEGTDQKSILLLSKAGQLLGRIVVTANNVAPVTVSPISIDFHITPADVMQPAEVSLTRNTTSPLPVEVGEKPAWIKARMLSSGTYTDLWQISVNPSTVPGPLDGAVSWGPSVQTGTAATTMTVTGYALGKIKSEPQSLAFPVVTQSTVSLVEFVLSGVTAGSLRAVGPLRINSDDPDVSVALIHDTSTEAVSGRAVLKPGRSSKSILNGQLMIENSNGKQMLRIPYQAIVLSN